MAWEKHREHVYYYKKQRIGGKVKSIYVGKGELAELISGIDDTIRRAKRQSASTKRRPPRTTGTNNTPERAS